MSPDQKGAAVCKPDDLPDEWKQNSAHLLSALALASREVSDKLPNQGSGKQDVGDGVSSLPSCQTAQPMRVRCFTNKI